MSTLKGWTQQEYANKVDWEGGIDQMVGWHGAGQDVLDDLAEIFDIAFANAFLQFAEQHKYLSGRLPEPV